MHLHELHVAVRQVIRDQESSIDMPTTSERLAVRALRRRVRAAGGDLRAVLAPVGSDEWCAARREQTVAQPA